MKKTLSLIMALVMCLSLCACGTKNNSEPSALTVFEIGTAASTDQCEITVSSCNFEEQWRFSDTVVHYEDKCFIVIKFFVRNVGKTNLNLGDVNPVVNYNDGYEFKADFFEYKGNSYSSAFLYSNTGSLEPLSEGKLMTAAIIVPKEVAENTSASLLINFSVPSAEGIQVLSFKVR